MREVSRNSAKKVKNHEINGLWEAAKFNSRLQTTEIALGHGVTSGDLWKLGYQYGEIDTNGNVDASKNTGNITRQTVSFSGLAQPFVQTYRYDSLDRIAEAIEKVNGNQTWKQTFGYDIYGNRNAFYQIIGSQVMTMNNLTLPTVDQNTNRFAINQGYGYDKNGSITTDPAMPKADNLLSTPITSKPSFAMRRTISSVSISSMEKENELRRKFIQAVL